VLQLVTELIKLNSNLVAHSWTIKQSASYLE
jgi:hypothetical protein